MRKALITGITGQDGSYLAELLLAKGYKVVGVYRRSSVPTFERIEHLRGNEHFSLACGDITDYASISAILAKERPDEVYNLAAQSHVGVSFSQPNLTWDVTAQGCVNILESLRHLYSETYQPRFYQASSSEMFGEQYDTKTVHYSVSQGEGGTKPYSIYQDTIQYQDENTRMIPQSPYAVAKLAAHNMTTLYRRSYGMFTASGILFNHESPRRGENFVTRKITKYIGGLAKEFGTLGRMVNADKHLAKKLKLGNLDASRDWGFAGDYVEAMWLMLQQDKGDDFVIGTGKTYTVRQFCEYAFGAVGLRWQDYVVTDIEFMRPAEVPYLCGDASKAKRVLGWEPKTSFEGLAHKMVLADIHGEASVR
jgi:GDPmannose 4,6-dehydratase